MKKFELSHKVLPKKDRVMEFHISGKARKKYGFENRLFSTTGNVVFSNLYQARVFADKINSVSNNGVKASDVFAMGLIDEILHFVIAEHRTSVAPKMFQNIIMNLIETMGESNLDKTLLTFIDQFPGSTIIENKETPLQLISRVNSNGVSYKEIILEEIVLLHISNLNPALSSFYELFDESLLKKDKNYHILIEGCKKEIKSITAIDTGDNSSKKSLYDLLREPALKHPDSLSDQLNFMMGHWEILITDFNLKMLKAMDSIKEEYRPVFYDFSGPAETFTQTYEDNQEDIENFTMDKHWMPNVVLLAKSTMVWLDQLSKKYKKEIDTLCKIPDEELDILASEGFNALWLIGLWNRSEASRKIKQRCGNAEAEASAYSLYNYDINNKLGGWEGLDALRERCAKRGIKLASDMVPNHTGIDSQWVRENPDYFIQTDYPPFPTYTFNSENLSDDPNIGIYLEDHYYSKDDCSVVFKRVDFNKGDTRYIYHGNDGTMMPWNDTAQINFLNPEAREAVIQDILHVAKNFPIIRFDAAMTLAKKHIQRLWYPKPGHGGDIASRSDYAITQEEFDRLLPQEFWREVVDRIAIEAPDTLLLAEAFWMLEGYFVRTLGMHRVYNSAFMNMLKNEENQKYRDSIINTINFDPEILKRYVNFMNNPDEETAHAQFGSGDKYFGVCTLMTTLPGLPMFGHGQIEGYKEKYGMEYSKAYWNEEVDEGLVNGHKNLIFPLMKQRELFSEVEEFNFYPLKDYNGNTNQNVFVYTNNYKGRRTLVLYNNAYSVASGWVNSSEEKLIKNCENRHIRTIKIAEALKLSNSGLYFVILRNQRDGLFYIRSSKQLYEQGMFFSLKEYETQVFMDISEVIDNSEGLYAKLHHTLNGKGVEDIDIELKKLKLGEKYFASKEFFTQKEVTPESVVKYLKHINAEDLSAEVLKATASKKGTILLSHIVDLISDYLETDIVDEWLFSNYYKEYNDFRVISFIEKNKTKSVLDLLKKDIVAESAGRHEFNGTFWFVKDNFEKTIDYISQIKGKVVFDDKKIEELIEKSGYDYKKLLLELEPVKMTIK